MKVFKALFLVLLIYSQSGRLQAMEKPASRPNIILILTDDQGYGDLGRHGHPLLKTPNLDRLYDESIRFDKFYVSPSCAPTRAALMTGMHEFRNGVTHTMIPRHNLYTEAVTLPDLLKTAGYRNGFIGKWHLGRGRDGSGYSPGDRGFDWTSTTSGGVFNFFDPDINRNGVSIPGKGYREDIYFDEAMAFIDESGDQPFFCYLATYSPHFPLEAPEEFTEPFRNRVVDEKTAAYLGMVANIDFNVGRLLNFLDERGIDENTIVIFMNDNGGTWGVDVYNAGMRGCKCTIWEGGTRAMSLWRWPGQWKPHTVESLTAHLDVLPTLCELAGVAIPDLLESELEGFSMVPMLESEKAVPWHDDRMLFQHLGRWPSGLAASHKYAMCAVRQGNFLLVHSRPCDDPECLNYLSQCSALRKVEKGLTKTNYTDTNAQFHWASTPPDRWALFDVKNDPACEQDISSANAEQISEMAEAYDLWWDDVFPLMIERGGDLGDPNRSVEDLESVLRELQRSRSN
ncbi:MAG: arylsulfatase [Bacteroides sp.]|nr:arylsulfatase [Bacteroides sp.]